MLSPYSVLKKSIIEAINIVRNLLISTRGTNYIKLYVNFLNKCFITLLVEIGRKSDIVTQPKPWLIHGEVNVGKLLSVVFESLKGQRTTHWLDKCLVN